MKRISISAVFVILLGLSSYAQGIKFFEGSFEAAKAEAGKQHKFLFIDCYTTWCGPCNMMTRDVFPLKEVGDYYNQTFVCYKMDMEKGEGKDVAKNYNVKAFPTYLFLNAAGELEHRTLGSKPAGKFISDGKTAADPKNNLKALATSFSYGERDTALCRKLTIIASDAEPELGEKAITAYWEAIPVANMTTKENWYLFRWYEKDINSKAFKYVSANKADFIAKYPENEVNNALYGRAADAMRTAADSKNEELLNQAKKLLVGCTDKNINITAYTNELRFYRITDRWNDYIKTADKYLAAYGDKEQYYNGVAWEIFSHANDQALLEKGLGYAEKSMKMEKNYGNSDTYANLLYKLKRYKEAETAAKESIALAKKEKLDYTSTQELLNQIRKSLSEIKN